ncbi:MAG: hypothetical protein ABH879_01960 [archaeon]
MKIHTRRKRLLSLVSGKRHQKRAEKKHGSKTFATEESAKKWAEENKVKEYKLEPAKKNRRFKVVSTG